MLATFCYRFGRPVGAEPIAKLRARVVPSAATHDLAMIVDDHRVRSRGIGPFLQFPATFLGRSYKQEGSLTPSRAPVFTSKKLRDAGST